MHLFKQKPEDVNSHLEGCNNTHAEAGEHPKDQRDSVETRALQPHQLCQLLHKLVSAVDGRGRCENQK